MRKMIAELTDAELLNIYNAPFPECQGKVMEYTCDEVLRRGLI